MLRPATPLTILLLASFVLLLLSVISTPIVKGIPIATFQGVNFGVFGYCKGSQCSGIKIGYSTDGLFSTTANAEAFDLPSGSRHTLSSILVVHPVAALLNLICLALAGAAHLHSPSHSQRYLLGLLILLLPTLLVTLLAFLVDILLFVPHVQWGGWIVLVSTILITASGIITCAMRRTLVTRKARKKRIAENAEMNGENYYSRQNTEPKYPESPLRNAEPEPLMVNGAPGADQLPNFATFEAGVRHNDDDRQPLNRPDGLSSVPSSTMVDSRSNGNGPYGPPRSRSHGRYEGPRDEFGNPLPSSQAFGPPLAAEGRPTPSGQPGRGQMDRMAPPSRGGYGPARGRGGYPPRAGYGPRGGYGGPRGPPPPGGFGRGGYPGDGRGGYGPRGRGGFGMAGVSAAGAAGMAVGAAIRRPDRGPPPTYPPQEGNLPPDQFGAQDPDFQRTPYAAYGARQQSPAGVLRSQSVPYQPPSGVGPRNQSPHSLRQPSSAGGFRDADSPPPLPSGTGGLTLVGHAAEMDGSNGRQMPTGYGLPANDVRESDPDVQGMVGLQENRVAFASNQYALQSPTSAYSGDYVPPRQNWNRTGNATTGHLAHDQVTAQAVELPTGNSAVGVYRAPSRPRVNSGGSDVYYEDVDPRFAAESDPAPPVQQRSVPVSGSLAPGAGHGMHDVPLAHAGSYEDLPGARSPAESDTSNFTSVSQRGVNPNWKPGGPGDATGPCPPQAMRKPTQIQVQQRRDVLLGNNPDFELPIPRPGRGRGGSVGMGGAGGMSRVPAPMSTFSTHGGRYPGTEV